MARRRRRRAARDARGLAASGGGRGAALGRPAPSGPRGGAARTSRLASAHRARRAGPDAPGGAERVAHPRGVRRAGRAGARGASAGAVRAAGDAPRGARARARGAAPALAGTPARAGHARPRRLLAIELLRRAARPPRPLSEASLAGGSAAGRTDAPREAARLTPCGTGPAFSAGSTCGGSRRRRTATASLPVPRCARTLQRSPAATDTRPWGSSSSSLSAVSCRSPFVPPARRRSTSPARPWSPPSPSRCGCPVLRAGRIVHPRHARPNVGRGRRTSPPWTRCTPAA